MPPEYAISALKEQNTRQDQRLDNHGDRIRGIELREERRDEAVGQLREAVEQLRSAGDALRGEIRRAIVALLLMAVANQLIDRFVS